MKPYRVIMPLALISIILSANCFANDIVVATDESTNAMAYLIGFVLLALVVSFLCSVAETVLLSVTPAFIAHLKEKDPAKAEVLQSLRQDKVDRSLAAILTMNTVAHTVGAIEAGAQSAVVFGSSWVGFFSAVMTLLILFFSEIIPKTLGAVFWPRLVTPMTWYIRALIILMYPLVQASEAITRVITRNREMPKFSRDEFVALASVGQESGEIDQRELRIIHNLFRFRQLTTVDIMTPRSVITGLPETLSFNEAINQTAKLPFSRIPIYKDSIDTITGFVIKNELLLHTDSSEQNNLLRSIRRPVEYVPESMSLPQLFETQLKQRLHIALVVDEYGDIKGLVTLEDTLETLLGLEIIDETDNIEDMQQWARHQWEARARKLGIPLPEELDADQQPSQTDDSKL